MASVRVVVGDGVVDGKASLRSLILRVLCSHCFLQLKNFLLVPFLCRLVGLRLRLGDEVFDELD